jgi:hypothetical protein
VAVETAEAFPTAFESEVILLAVATPLLDAAKGVLENVKVATAVPGDDTVPAKRKTNLGLVPSSATTAFVAASFAALLWVIANFFPLLSIN